MQVFVRDNNVDKALRVLKKKMQREGIFRAFRNAQVYMKPGDKRRKQKAEGRRRTTKAAFSRAALNAGMKVHEYRKARKAQNSWKPKPGKNQGKKTKHRHSRP